MQTIILLLSAAALISANPAPGTSPDSASWSVEVSTNSAASGYRWNDIYATYSASPDQQNHCYWLYNPIKGSGETSCDQPGFYAELKWEGDSEVVTVRQTVGTDILTGSAVVEMACGLGGNGRRCEGAVVVAVGAEA